MPLPNAEEARPFYRSSLQRFEDARFLLEAGRTTGAVYLAGYGVECILKALILSALPAGGRQAMLSQFRGARAHSYDWLRTRYFENGGPPFPSDVSRALALVNTWDTDLRYQPGTTKRRDAEAFLRSAQRFIEFADGRL